MLTAKSGLRLWSAAHPLWMCGMRPFFVATAWGAWPAAPPEAVGRAG